MINKLAEFRAKHGLTQEELAEKAQVDRGYISNIETGAQKVISNIVMQKLAKALNETVCDIFFADDVVYTRQNTNE